MPIYYLDTSALVKRYKTEQGSETINELFNGKSSDEVFACSQFAAVEIEATLSRALKAHLLNRRAYAAILGRFSQDLTETIMMHPVSSVILSDAAELARRYALRAAIPSSNVCRGTACRAPTHIFIPGAPRKRGMGIACII